MQPCPCVRASLNRGVLQVRACRTPSLPGTGRGDRPQGGGRGCGPIHLSLHGDPPCRALAIPCIGDPNSTIGIGTQTNAHGDPYLLVRPTRVGDLNLDGVVTISDLIDLAANFGSTSATWQEGDLNYDNEVSISDFIDAAANFGASYTADSVVGTATPVPEPFAVTLLLLPVAAIRRKRR